jgi:hypothetical protein
MPRKQMNIRLDELTRETIKRIAERWNMSESQVITRGVVLLEKSLGTRFSDIPENHISKEKTGSVAPMVAPSQKRRKKSGEA